MVKFGVYFHYVEHGYPFLLAGACHVVRADADIDFTSAARNTVHGAFVVDLFYDFASQDHEERICAVFVIAFDDVLEVLNV